MNCQEKKNSLADKSMEQQQQQYDDDNSVTMIDVLQEENQLEEDANAVLGPADDKNCTYSQVTHTHKFLLNDTFLLL